MAKFETMEERLDRLESKVDGLEQTAAETLAEMRRLSDRVYGVEDRMGAWHTKLDVSVDALRADIKLTMERLEGLRQYMERSREEDRLERAADRGVVFALARDHNRRLRAIERLENRRRRV